MDEIERNNNEICRTGTFNSFYAGLRLMSVICVTAGLVLLLISVIFKATDLFDLLILLTCFMFFITGFIIIVWIYSFIKSIFWHSLADKKLLKWHLIDLVLIGIVVLLSSRPPFYCNADVLAEHYDRYGPEMKRIVTETKALLPDTTSIQVEFDSHFKAVDYPELSERQLKELHRTLDDVGCIGIDIYRGHPDFVRLRYCRVGMGMYSFRLFIKPLTAAQRDSVNDDVSLIVYNDTTVFEYGAGAFGDLGFVGKNEFLQKMSQSKM